MQTRRARFRDFCKDNFRNAGRKAADFGRYLLPSRRSMRRLAVAAGATAAMSFAGLMLSKPAHAEEGPNDHAVVEPPEPSVNGSVRISGGFSGPDENPVVSVGGSLNIPAGERATVNVGLDIATDGNDILLDNLDLGLTLRVNDWLSLTTPMIYSSPEYYCGANLGIGAAIHLSLGHGIGLHAAPHVGFWNNSLMLPVFMTFNIRDRANILLKAIIPTNTAALGDGSCAVPRIGGEAIVTVNIAQGWSAFGRYFFMTLSDGQFGTHSMRVGVSRSF